MTAVDFFVSLTVVAGTSSFVDVGCFPILAVVNAQIRAACILFIFCLGKFFKMMLVCAHREVNGHLARHI